ncbi:helix-turn-helix transcriptional regulator [Microbacterium capsulatum]|uniref:Helix-turn-helix transcriptional regulator n=1 Tax=Microbacterium capsulatum TaxID=3041921 RepID=A0ABU0XLK5_9MICO|nr:helix-turn-helix transcriptional regulator [Microbacterium sp. ASV81]MDQ4215494.1 helix-turn-helix transcriptional regulator [Microbacterium sp. ASV81]
MPRVPSAAAAHIGARIRTARESSTMTQDQLAVRSDIDSSNIRAYETGRSLPNLQTLVRIADALRTPAGYFLEGVTVEMFPVAASDGRRRGR